MNDRKRYLAAHWQAGFKIIVRFRLIDEMEKHQNSQPCIWSEHEDIVKVLAAGIKDKALTRYNLTDDYVREKYGIENVVTAALLCEIAFYQAGCEAKEAYSHPTFEYLKEIGENMDSGFLDGYQLERAVQSQLVENLEGKALEAAGQSRGYERKEGALCKFCEKLDAETDEDVIIGKIDHYNDGTCLDMAPAVSTLAWMLKENEYWEEYYRLLEVLRYFPLQDGLIRCLGNVEDIVTLVNTVEAHNGRKSIHYLLRERCFTMLSEEGNLLSANLRVQFLTDDDKDYVKSVLADFENNKSGHVKNMVCVWLKVFGIEELTTWLSKKKTEAERKNKKYGQPELEIIKMMMEAYTLTTSDISGFNLEGKSFESLLVLAEHADDQAVCEKIIRALQKNIFSEQSYPPTTLNDLWFKQVRTIYQCLEKSGVDGFLVLKQTRRPFEGYRVDIGEAMRNVRQEGYWLAMLLMSLEENGDEIRFDQYVDVLFRDSKYALESLSDDVFAPYYVAELLVSQVMKGKKNDFEMQLIENIPYLVFVIRVLTGNDGVMSAEVMQLLKERIKNEWETERKLLEQRKTGNLQFYEEYVKGVMKYI